MTAEVADGLLVMPFGSKRFLHEVTMPNVDDGLARRAASREDFAVVPEIIVSVADEDPDHTATRAAAGVLRVDARLPPGARRARLG